MNKHKFVFIGGLHRSGTSLLADILKQHPDISGFKNTEFPEDEGQFLQTVYPIAKEYGGPGKFAFRKEMHLTEKSDLLTEGNKKKIFEEWSQFWDLEKKVLLEKSPPNIIKMRFLQSIFPGAYFIVMVRDPVAVSMATRKWTDSPVNKLIHHWIIAHKILNKDKKFIKRLIQIRYEDLIRSPQEILSGVMSFIGIHHINFRIEIKPDINEEYREKYCRDWEGKTLTDRFFFKMKGAIYENNVQRFGYSLTDVYKK